MESARRAIRRDEVPPTRLDEAVADVTKDTSTVAEYNVGGHRLYYVALFVQALNQAGLEVEVLLPRNSTSTPQWAEQLGGMHDAGWFHLSEVEVPLPLQKGRDFRLWCRFVLQAAAGKTLIIPSADWLLPYMLMEMIRMKLRRQPLPKATHIVSLPYTFHWLCGKRGLPGWPRRAATSAAMALLMGFGFVNKPSWYAVSATNSGTPFVNGLPRYARRLVAATDPVDDTCDISTVQRLHAWHARGKKTVCLAAGDLGRRKGLDVLLETWQRYGAEELADYRLVVAGAIAPEDRDLLDRLQGMNSTAIDYIEGYLPNRTFDALVHAADLVLLVFNEYSAPSGMYTRARNAMIPAVVAGNQYLSELSQRDRYGIVANPTPSALVGAIREAQLLGKPGAKDDASDQPPSMQKDWSTELGDTGSPSASQSQISE